MDHENTPRWPQKLEAIRKFLSTLIWMAVAVVILATVGKYFLFRSDKASNTAHDSRTYAPILEPIPFEKVDKAIADAAREASREAENVASRMLDTWIEQLMQRADDDFLEWYFSYWNQTAMGLKSLYHEGFHYINEKHPTAAEKITEEIQEEFTKRVLRPQIAQMELERISREVMNQYALTLRERLQTIPGKYKIPHADWDRYLEDISVLTSGIPGDRGTPLTLKTLYASSAGGAVVLASKVQVLASKIGSKVADKSAGKAASTMAAKTGGKVAAKAGGKLLGPIIGIGILVWDVWDHSNTKEINKPIMRRALSDYFAELKDSLLNDSETGIMASIHEIEASVLSSMRGK